MKNSANEKPAKIQHQSDLILKGNTREGIRAELLQKWLHEKSGALKEHNYYRYNVETASDGVSIFLLRPARLNKGCDFAIHCLEKNEEKSLAPTHTHILDSFRKHSDLAAERDELLKAAQDVYECKNIALVTRDLNIFKNNCAIERLLKVTKWMFIEQDMTYWSQSGRASLLEAIKNVCARQTIPAVIEEQLNESFGDHPATT